MNRGLFTLYPNLYVGLVGPTGIGKSTAAEIGVDHFGPTVKQVGSEVMRGKITSWYLYEWFGKMSQAGKPAVALVFSSELKTLLGDLNKAELVAMLTDIYGCPKDQDYRTKTHGVIKVQNAYVTLLVCSTPEWLTLGISSDDVSGGFTGRFIYVCCDKTNRTFPFPEDFYGASEIEEAKGELIEDLGRIGALEGPIIMTDEAKARYVVWYKDRMQEMSDERLLGYFSRKRDHLLKVAMLMSVSEGDSLVVTEDHIKVAQLVLSGTEDTMMMAFKGVVCEPLIKYREVVLDQIRGLGETTVRELLRKNSTRLDADGLHRILEGLSREGRVTYQVSGQDRQGRPTWKVVLTEGMQKSE